MDFNEYTKKSSDPSSVWFHFLRSTKGSEAKCKLCFRIFKVSGSTSTLHMHLKNVHAISHTPTTASTTSSTSTNENNDTPSTSVKRQKMTDYYKSEDSLDYVIARMVSLDGVAFKLFCTSEDLKKILRKSGYKNLPSSPNTVRNTVIRVHKDEMQKLKEEINQLKIRNVKFGLTFDEWTSSNNHRYININIHSKSFKNGRLFHNLGLIRIQGSMPAEICISLIQARLAFYNLTFNHCDNNVIAMTTDGASVMCKVGRLLPIFHQICHAHGIHLAICDVIYAKNNSHLPLESAVDQRNQSSSSCDDVNVSDDEENSVTDGEFVVERAGSASPLNLNFRSIVKKVRTVVKLFKNSPTKNDSVLQKHVQNEFGKELSLLLDCKTRWSSMATMLERFTKLRICIQKSLIDIKSEISFTNEEFLLIEDLHFSLDIVKATVEALCKRDATLITADTAMKLMIKSLDEKEGVLTKTLCDALKKRIKERRLHCVAGTLLYLHDPDEFSKLSADTDTVFCKPSHAEIVDIICKAVKSRVNHDLSVPERDGNIDIADAESSESPETTSESSDQLSFREKLAIELNRMNKVVDVPRRQPDTDIPSLVRVEMALFEDSGSRGRYLEAAYKHLQCIPPTSVESERVFSAAGLLCNRIRSRLNDDTLDALSFLRSHFIFSKTT